jgi:hypothetical protein
MHMQLNSVSICFEPVLAVSIQHIAGHVAAVKEAAATQRNAQLERLDKGLVQLAGMVSGASAEKSREHTLLRITSNVCVLVLASTVSGASAKNSREHVSLNYMCVLCCCTFLCVCLYPPYLIC